MGHRAPADSSQLGPPPEPAKTEEASPGAGIIVRASVPPINTQDRADVVAFYDSVYKDSNGVDAQWTGDVDTCTAGDTSAAYKDATLLRINYFRAMTGLPGDVVFDTAWNADCREAALMMIAEGSLSHSPPPSWACYSAAGASAAGKSNLALGRHGPGAIDLYILDSGSNNTAVGHRRWILYPPQETMGCGSTTASNGWYLGSNALRVIGGSGARPATPEWVAWPPSGYVPYSLVYPRWSFSYPRADFSNATISMTHEGQPVAATKLPVSNGYADNTVVWEPQGIPSSRPSEDEVYSVTVSNVLIDSQPRQFTYNVILIDPAAPSVPLKPDLTGELQDVAPSPIVAGGPVSFSGTIRNAGAGTAAGSAWVEFWAINNSSGWSGLLCDSYSVGVLLPGESIDLAAVPARDAYEQIPPGTYSIEMRIDVAGAVDEDNEDNNVASWGPCEIRTQTTRSKRWRLYR